MPNIRLPVAALGYHPRPRRRRFRERSVIVVAKRKRVELYPLDTLTQLKGRNKINKEQPRQS